MTTEWPVYAAILFALSDLSDIGVRFTRHGDEVCCEAGGVCRFIPARDLIDDADPCAIVAEVLGL
jgi:hypothetical protein